MKSFLVEAYLPTSELLAEIEAHARDAAAAMSDAGTPTRYVRAVFVPEDETTFHLIEGPSADAAQELARRAGIAVNRIVEAASSLDGGEDGHGTARSERRDPNGGRR